MYLITSAFSGTLGLIFLALWAILSFYTIVNILRTHTVNEGSKILWLIVIIVVPIIGALFYLFWRKVKTL
ncbi:MAG TPA: PLDc N-terminal domain-containing protein [Mucilaginibacter sp.]|nr:PLDc N-terminal domain-containing protein [Mucilaginibacter sp.]